MKKELIDQLTIDFTSPLPVYEQIIRALKQALARHTLITDDPLPSIRELASFLKVNPNTVARAYRELQHDGVVGGRAGKGYWVESTGELSNQNQVLVRDLFLDFLHKAVEMGASREDLEQLVEEFFAEREP